ncbi:prolyl oligopeptidase family serine peptidase [Streptomyces sp. NPDC085946]|uniref:prolyl oligopeptidase family serine peptidase n=1 Tax=Streptomyces sp. NPDC085946 TaxID=3365744 RepID=UPI0037CD578F
MAADARDQVTGRGAPGPSAPAGRGPARTPDARTADARTAGPAEPGLRASSPAEAGLQAPPPAQAGLRTSPSAEPWAAWPTATAQGPATALTGTGTGPDAAAAGPGGDAPGLVRDFGGGGTAEPAAPPPRPAPALVVLPDSAAVLDDSQLLTTHGCWYPSVDPTGRYAAFICDRGGVPQLWTGPVDGDEVHLLDADRDPVTEVSWSPDGRWIAYTTAPGGGELTRVLCVRPDGTGRRVLAGAEPGSSAHLGRWRHDGSALAVTVAEPSPVTDPAEPEAGPAWADTGGHPPGWASRDGRAVLLGGAPAGARPRPHAVVDGTGTAPGGDRAALDEPVPLTLSAYLVDPEGVSAPVFLASERGAATLRVCDLSRDGRLALLRRGPRGRREALVVRTDDLRVTCALRVADGDPWIGGFAPDGRTLWLRSDEGREHAALVALRLGPRGERLDLTVAAERADCGLELLALDRTGHRALLSWNVRGASDLRIAALDTARGGTADGVPPRHLELPHEVVTRVVPTADPDSPVVALSGSQRRPGVWWLPGGTALRTPWSSRDEDVVAPGSHPPVRPVPLRPVARDGLHLGGWYYRAPGRSPGEPAPCVVHLHGGPEEQERPVFDPLYHELLGRGLDVFAPDVRGSSGYGRSFVDADLGTGRFAALDDVADCAAHAVLAGLADPRRLAVMGRSYGGYLVMASLVWHPELFRTGVAVCGMSDFATFFAGTQPWIAQSAAHKYGHPERDRDLLHALSPMGRIDALRAPVLAVHGEHDTNVPPGESEQFVRAARERGLEAELLVLRDEGHDFRRADNRRLFRRAAADWIQRHLRG